jgi:hypothetical protein
VRKKLVLQDTFRVLEAGPWDADSFGPVRVALYQTRGDAFFPSRMVVSVTQPKGGELFRFDASTYQFEGGTLRVFCDKAVSRWVFRTVQ